MALCTRCKQEHDGVAYQDNERGLSQFRSIRTTTTVRTMEQAYASLRWLPGSQRTERTQLRADYSLCAACWVSFDTWFDAGRPATLNED